MGRPQTMHQLLPALWRLIRHFWPYIRKRRGLVAGSLSALLAEVGFRLLEPWPLKFVFDRVIVTAPSGGRSGIPVIDALAPMPLLALCALGVVIITGLRALAAYTSTVGFALIGNRVLTDVRSDLYRHLQSLSLSFFGRARSGDLIIRVIGDVAMLREVAVTAFLPLAGSLLVLAGMVGVMTWLHWQLTLVALATVPLFWVSTARLGRRIQQVARQQRQQEGAMAATAAESIGAIKVVQALSLGETFAQAFSSHNRRSLKEGVKASRLAARMERTVDVLAAIATALVLLYGARLVLRNALTPGDLLVFLAYLRNALKPTRDFAKYTGRLAKAAAAGERVLDLMQMRPDVQDLPGAVRAPAFRGAVRFEDVSFAYEPGRPALDGIECEVQPEQLVALLGPSGSGKSTLVSLMLRLFDPGGGRVRIDGRDIREYTLESLRAQISAVLQDSILFAATVRENIAYSNPGASIEQIETAARAANAHDFITALPDGYDTALGERGVTLSNGQRQRIAIARAALRNAPILILDEPTVGLDEDNERAVLHALQQLAMSRTTFLITHDLSVASRADVILYLERGRIAERGTHEELMRGGGRYAGLYRLQMDAASTKERYVAGAS